MKTARGDSAADRRALFSKF